jgi:hypothetical protein
MPKNTSSRLLRHNLRTFKQLYPSLGTAYRQALCDLTHELGLSLIKREISWIDGGWYITHAGLLRIATHRRCLGIRTVLQQKQSDPITHRWVFKATVFKSRESLGFVGYGDAVPSNVSSWVRGSEMRVAETRAVNRALRKAYGIGLCSVEELGWVSESVKSPEPSRGLKGFHISSGSNGSPGRLRDQLCLLIRQYSLDPTLVKEYAAHFCGTETIKDASRELVESFISHLSSSAKEDIDGLICKLNSFSRPAEVKQ